MKGLEQKFFISQISFFTLSLSHTSGNKKSSSWHRNEVALYTMENTTVSIVYSRRSKH